MRIKVTIEYEDYPWGDGCVTPHTLTHSHMCEWDDDDTTDHVGWAIYECVNATVPRPLAAMAAAVCNYIEQTGDSLTGPEEALSNASQLVVKEWADIDRGDK